MTTNNEHPYSNKLENALARLAAGIPKKEILAGANSDAEWLAPMLEIATEVGELRHTIRIPPPDASLHRLLAHAETLAAVSEAAPETNQPASLSSPPGRWGTGLFVWVAAALLLIGALLGSLNIAAQDALPGDLLYPVKKASETLRLYLPWNFEQHAPSLESTPPALIVPSPTASPSSTATPTETPLPPTVTSTSIPINNPVVVDTPSPTETAPTDIPTDNDTSDVDINIENEADLNDNTDADNNDVDTIDNEDDIDDSLVDDMENVIEDNFDDSNDTGNNNDTGDSKNSDGSDDIFDDSGDNNDSDGNKDNRSDDNYEDEGENPGGDDNPDDDNGSDDDKGSDDDDKEDDDSS